MDMIDPHSQRTASFLQEAIYAPKKGRQPLVYMNVFAMSMMQFDRGANRLRLAGDLTSYPATDWTDETRNPDNVDRAICDREAQVRLSCYLQGLFRDGLLSLSPGTNHSHSIRFYGTIQQAGSLGKCFVLEEFRARYGHISQTRTNEPSWKTFTGH